jgi:DNA-binding MarR family transcriptional regulator/N-acetylglutamate synthase-like GNAT family acetyltransferase
MLSQHVSDTPVSAPEFRRGWGRSTLLREIFDKVKESWRDEPVSEVAAKDVSAIRSFSRFYTNRIGVLREGLLDSPYSLTEARVLFELGRRRSMDLAMLRRALDIDPGYLSRIITRFDADGLVARGRSANDGRRQVLRLTAQGRRAFKVLDARSGAQVRTLLEPLSEAELGRLVEAMTTIREILGDARREGSIVLREPRSGDHGWVVSRHGSIYASEYGWDETFEGLVAGIVAALIESRDAARERAWIAELDGERAGCVFCVKRKEGVAQLRLLLVEPWARGRGIGGRLVEECVRFAKEAGYGRMVLWTNSVLDDARRLYERAGFSLVEENEHHSFGHDLVGQTWSRDL